MATVPQPAPVNPRREAFRRGNRIREQLRLRGEYTQSDFIEAVLNACPDLTHGIHEWFIRDVCDKIDKSATAPRPCHLDQPDLPGFDLEGDYRLGDGRRIAKRFAQRQHIEAALAISDANLVAVQTANLGDRQEYLRLLPYLGPGVTKEQAAEAYRADNPDDP